MMHLRAWTLIAASLLCNLLLWGCTAVLHPGLGASGTNPSGPQAPYDAAQVHAQTQAQEPEPIPRAPLAAQYAALQQAGGQLLRLQPAASRLRIHVFRAGRAPGLGHNHVLSAPEFEGFVYLPGPRLADGRFDLEFRLDQLALDVPAQRAELGPAFASVLSDAAIAATREHMLGPDNMQAERYPLVRIHSLAIAGEAPQCAARIAVELHGQTRELWVPLTVGGLPQRLTVSGSLVLRQSDFGVQPYSVMGGLLAVQDAVVLTFELVAT